MLSHELMTHAYALFVTKLVYLFCQPGYVEGL